MELLRRRAQALGKQLPGRPRGRQLAAPRGEDRALDPDDVAEVEPEQALVGVAELVDASLDLDLAGAVLQVEEGGLAVPALRGQAAGDAVAVAVSSPGSIPSWDSLTAAISVRSGKPCG